MAYGSWLMASFILFFFLLAVIHGLWLVAFGLLLLASFIYSCFMFNQFVCFNKKD